jgi:hypothetical protein
LHQATIGFRQRTLEKISPSKLRSRQNLTTFNRDIKVINTVLIQILKPLIDPIFEGEPGGWFSCPNALQAKIIHALFTAEKFTDLKETFKRLTPLTLRRFFLYLNSHDGSQDADHMDLNAVEFWEHVSPSKIIVNNGFKYIRDWDSALNELDIFNQFFAFMEDQGLMKGAKAFPYKLQKNRSRRIYHDKRKQEYTILFKRSPEVPLNNWKKKKLCTHNS